MDNLAIEELVSYSEAILDFAGCDVRFVRGHAFAPELVLMASIVVLLKLHYGLDGNTRLDSRSFFLGLSFFLR